MHNVGLGQNSMLSRRGGTPRSKDRPWGFYPQNARFDSGGVYFDLLEVRHRRPLFQKGSLYIVQLGKKKESPNPPHQRYLRQGWGGGSPYLWWVPPCRRYLWWGKLLKQGKEDKKGGRSSIGRSSALHAECRRFESDRLQKTSDPWKTAPLPKVPLVGETKDKKKLK